MMVICGSWVPCAAFIGPPAQPFASAQPQLVSWANPSARCII
ncbi:hypothetical protein [Samia cynthia nucleopolyhedrovirus]|nr:hypothetical protein [Antheraea yamamai nucleopolyhedrovirus]BBD50678.1 hypothetical protein [Samia cynthia nucleopolyhedrovirus]